MRRRLEAEIALCCEELESLHCLGGAMLDPLLQFAKDSDLGWARGSVMKVLTDLNSVDYGDDAAVSKRAKGVIKHFKRLVENFFKLRRNWSQGLIFLGAQKVDLFKLLFFNYHFLEEILEGIIFALFKFALQRRNWQFPTFALKPNKN